MSRSRSWCFTLNNYTQADEKRIQEEKSFRYVIYGREVGQSGTPHLQGYCCFSTLKSLQQVRSIVGMGAHCETAKGTATQNIAYCSKEGNTFFKGDPPSSERKQAEDQRELWDNYVSDAKQGEFDNIPSRIFVQYYSTWKRVFKDYGTSPPDLNTCCGIWIWGPPGVGKSFKCRADYPGAFIKLRNKWWDGYQGQETVILDDFDKSLECLGGHLKIWADAYSFPAEIKGGVLQVRPRRIIITSNYSIGEIFSEGTLRAAIERRFTVTYCPLRLW